jgi:hypothetical protein
MTSVLEFARRNAEPICVERAMRMAQDSAAQLLSHLLLSSSLIVDVIEFDHKVPQPLDSCLHNFCVCCSYGR